MTSEFPKQYSKVTLPDLIGQTGIFVDGDWIESKDQDINGDVRLIQLADIGVGVYLNKSNRFMTTAKAKILKCTILKPGDILIARMPDPIGRACIFPGEEMPCVTVVDVCIFRPDSSLADSSWLVHRINSSGFRNEISTWVTGTTRQRISRGNLSHLKFPLPPLDEQRRIAAILDKADAIRRKRQESIRLAEEFLRSAFLDIFGDPVTNPKGWNVIRLEDIADIQSGITKGRKLNGQKTISLPYMRVANVQDGHISLGEIKEIEATPIEVDRYRLISGDILLTEGGDPDKLGRGAVWQGEIDPCIHQNHIFRVRPNPAQALPAYLSALIGSARGKQYFLGAAKQTTGIASINKTQLNNFPALLPPLELQRLYSDLVRKKEELLLKLSGTGNLQWTCFKSLTHCAFSGEL